MKVKHCKGSAVVDIVVFASLIVFIMLPLFTFMFEKHLINEKCQRIKDAADMANLAVYYSMSAGNLSMTEVYFDSQKAMDIYSDILADNLRLNGSLAPEEGSIADGPVKIDELILYTSGQYDVCPQGVTIEKPSIHCVIDVPVKPVFYRQFVLSLLGKEYINLKIHIDSEIPVNR